MMWLRLDVIGAGLNSVGILYSAIPTGTHCKYKCLFRLNISS
jgi:hypothetical protein